MADELRTSGETILKIYVVVKLSDKIENNYPKETFANCKKIVIGDSCFAIMKFSQPYGKV